MDFLFEPSLWIGIGIGTGVGTLTTSSVLLVNRVVNPALQAIEQQYPIARKLMPLLPAIWNQVDQRLPIPSNAVALIDDAINAVVDFRISEEERQALIDRIVAQHDLVAASAKPMEPVKSVAATR